MEELQIFNKKYCSRCRMNDILKIYIKKKLIIGKPTHVF